MAKAKIKHGENIRTMDQATGVDIVDLNKRINNLEGKLYGEHETFPVTHFLEMLEDNFSKRELAIIATSFKMNILEAQVESPMARLARMMSESQGE